MDNNVEAKQKYLCSEIMMKGYDPDDFTQWMDTNTDRGRHADSLGCDLERWSADELAVAVKEYQDSHVKIDVSEQSQPASPEKNSPSAVSDKMDYSSIHSRSIPVMGDLLRKLSFCSKSKTVKIKVRAYTYT